MKSRFYAIILINLFILVLLIYHEKILSGMDYFIMPNSAELCKVKPTGLIEKMKMKTEALSFTEIESELKHLGLQKGGLSNKSKYNLGTPRIAIIVPYRDRLHNLELFLRNIHPFLSKQPIYYGVFIVEPVANLTFNKGISMNAGFLEALKEEHWDCFIFHDVDLLPESELNIYGCDKKQPRLLAVAISAYGYSIEGYFKNKYFGGVTAFTKEQFEQINGFSNLYYGWGLEDDDARLRVLAKYDSISRIPAKVGRYYANCHEQQTRNPDRFLLYINAKNRQDLDGLTSLKYTVTRTESTHLFKRFYISYENNY